MTNSNNTKTAAANSSRKLTATSKDGKWKTFLHVPGLMLYIPSGQYFARVKVKGIVKRASLKTDVFTTAKERLPLKRKELLSPTAPVPELGTFADARLAWLANKEGVHALAALSEQLARIERAVATGGKMIFDIQEAASLLSVSVVTLRKLIRQRRIKVIPDIRKVLIPRSELEKFAQGAK